VPALHSYDYAVLRVVPRVEREEFVNVGVVLHCRACRFLAAAVDVDRERLLALDPELDLATVERHLAAIPRICAGGEGAGPLGHLSQGERFHWLTTPRSTIIQPSPVHAGLCEDPAAALQHLLATMVRRPGSPPGDSSGSVDP
jgi:hypothetical protein